jgi:hypothetical protein
MPSTPKYSQLVGRVGTLAVALGIGSAIATPQIACADDAAPSNPTSAATGDTDKPADSDPAPADTPQGRERTPEPVDGPDSDDEDPTDLRDQIPEPEPEADPEVEEADNTDDVEEEAGGPYGSGPPTTVEANTPIRKGGTSTLLAKTSVVTNTLAADDDPQPSAIDKSNANKPSPARAQSALAASASADEPLISAAEAALPNVTIKITHQSAAPNIKSPIGSFVRNILRAFGYNFNPPFPHTNPPILDSIWGAYRRWESQNFNALPAVNDVTIAGTGFTGDGRLALDIAFDVSDYDGDPFIVSAHGINPDLVETGPGTYTYFADSDFTGTVPLDFGAVDFGNHRHAGPFSDPFRHSIGFTVTITVLAEELA